MKLSILTAGLLLSTTVLAGAAQKKQQAQLIKVETAATGLYFVCSDSDLYQSYYGLKLSEPEQLLKAQEFCTDAFPSYGTGNPNEQALMILHADGNPTTVLSVTGTQTRTDDSDPNVVTTEISLKDRAYPVEVTLSFKAFQKENVIQTRVTVANRGEERITIGKIASACLNFTANSFYISHLWGTPGYESNLMTERLTEGTKVIDSKRGTRTSHYDNPSFMLSLGREASETAGEVAGGVLCWSGNYRMAFQVDALGGCSVSAGINDFASAYTLSKGESFESPWLAVTFSADGKGEVTRNFHNWGRNYMLNEPLRLRPVVLNSWEGVGMNFTEDVILKMIDDAADLGAEVFVLDDGWFGNKYPRNDERNGLGDWDYNRKKLPNGLTKFIERAQQRGIMFGIWIEPEMVNPSELAEKHPDWIVSASNRQPLLQLSRQRSQQILDLANPAVQDFVFGVFDRIMQENPQIGYVKWDANRFAPGFES